MHYISTSRPSEGGESVHDDDHDDHDDHDNDDHDDHDDHNDDHDDDDDDDNDEDEDDHDDDDWTKLCPIRAARTRWNHIIDSSPGVKTARDRYVCTYTVINIEL